MFQFVRPGLKSMAVMLFLLQFQLLPDQTPRGESLIGDREGSSWTIPVDAFKTNGKFLSVEVPRVFASLRSAHFNGHPDKTVQVRPGVKDWEIRFPAEQVAANGVDKASIKNVVLNFDSYPATLNETSPTKQLGDGTMTLPCSLGRTSGEKLRFEPQPHKNTIGFWTKQKDSVSWPIVIERPGKFNVGLLQGAGESGGGVAKISILKNGEVLNSVEYNVNVTGHYQNFVWQHAGTLAIEKPGEYVLRVEAVEINRTALMDIRQIHLSPVPQ